jgi:hypothetical protein
MVSAVPAGEVMARDEVLGQHRGAVARNAPDAVLVHHQRLVPVEATAGGDHGFGQEVDLLAVQLGAVAGNHEGGQLDLGIAVAGDVAHDGLEVLASQALAGDFLEQGSDRGRRLGLRQGGGVPVLGPELTESVLRQTQLVAGDDAGVVHHVDAGQDAPAIGAHLDFGQGLEALGPVGFALAVQVHHVLVPGVDGHAPDRQP